MKNVLTIAGSDSSGGAGIQTDLKTFAANGVYGMSVITAITAQNTVGVTKVEKVSKEMVGAQLDAVFSDIPVDGIKIGMLLDEELVQIIYEHLEKYRARNIVLDPVMISTSGCDLICDSAKKLMIDKLFKIADLVTPNIAEAVAICDYLYGVKIDIKCRQDMVDVADRIQKYTSKPVLIKGGHLVGEACDLLLIDGKPIVYKNERIDTKNTHGTGCTLSSAIASNLAKGYDMDEAVARSKNFITMAIKNSLNIGRGHGPTNPMGEIYKKLEMIDYEE